VIEQPLRLQLSRRKGFDLQTASRDANDLPTSPAPAGLFFGGSMDLGKLFQNFWRKMALDNKPLDCRAAGEVYTVTAQDLS
jgi:hypothetical protein